MISYMRDNGKEVVDVDQKAEEAYVQHCHDADVMSAPLRDCVTYYNGEGTAKPGSLAYYGGKQWNERVEHAQQTLEPYVFE